LLSVLPHDFQERVKFALHAGRFGDITDEDGVDHLASAMNILESVWREAKEGSGRFSAPKGLQGSAKGFQPLAILNGKLLLLAMNPSTKTALDSGCQNSVIEDDRTGLTVENLKRAFADNLFYAQGKFPAIATKNDFYMALAYTARDRLLHRWINTIETYIKQKEPKVVCYLSAEFLLGPRLGNSLVNLGIYNEVRQAVEELGLDLNELLEQEAEPGLGNGGLGRLAACYMDSLSTLEIPAIGYGIRYEFGIFSQEIQDGWQIEIADKWLRLGDPWELPRPESAVDVNFGGRTEAYSDDQGRYRVRWIPGQVVKGVPHDMAILGYRVNTANTLRLWKAEAQESSTFRSLMWVTTTALSTTRW